MTRVESSDLKGRTALVTGASGGLGGSIAVALARHGARLILLGRDETRTKEVAGRIRALGLLEPEIVLLDLMDDTAVRSYSAALSARLSNLDIVVHAAGGYDRGKIADAPVEDLDRLYHVNLRAPYLLTQLLLPLLARRGGDVVFLNSSQGVAASPTVGAYAATKHGLAAVADSLRAEANELDIRVLTVFLGRTATPMQERIFAAEARSYNPESLLQPDEVATMVCTALCLERSAEVTTMTLRPNRKSY